MSLFLITVKSRLAANLTVMEKGMAVVIIVNVILWILELITKV